MARAISKFNERLSPRQRVVVLGLAAIELTMKILAMRDIGRRPASEIRGPKLLWRLALIVNTLGPLSYFKWGRRRR